MAEDKRRGGLGLSGGGGGVPGTGPCLSLQLRIFFLLCNYNSCSLAQ